MARQARYGQLALCFWEELSKGGCQLSIDPQWSFLGRDMDAGLPTCGPMLEKAPFPDNWQGGKKIQKDVR